MLLMQPYPASRVRQSLASHPSNPALPPGQNRSSAFRQSKQFPDNKGKARAVDQPSSNRASLGDIAEDREMSDDERRPGAHPSDNSQQGSSSPSKLTQVANTQSHSTVDPYRRRDSLAQYPYLYNQHYSTSYASPSTSQLLPPRITVNSPSSSQPTAKGPSSGPTSTTTSTPQHAYPSSQSHYVAPQPSASSQRRRSRSKDLGTSSARAPGVKSQKRRTVPLSGDAYAEHLLLAARRIGRERTSIVAGLQQHADREKDVWAREQEQIRQRYEQERLEKERLDRLASGTSGMAYYRSTEGVMVSPPQRLGGGRGSYGSLSALALPRTPKKSGGGVGASHYPILASPAPASGSGPNNKSNTSSAGVVGPSPSAATTSTFVFVNTSAESGGVSGPGYAGSGIMGTPGQPGGSLNAAGSGNGRGLGQKSLPSNPPTPLDSLLDAARMMDDEKVEGKTNARRRALEHPESPVPKRRRISSGAGAGGKLVARGGRGGKVDPVRSALHVLADQAAAAFNEPDEPVKRSSAGVGVGRGKWKAKGKEKEKHGGSDSEAARSDDEQQQPTASTWSRGQARGRGRGSTAIAPPSVSSRPVRHASRKRLVSPEARPAASTTTSRGRGRPRGRPRGSKSRPRPIPTSASASEGDAAAAPRLLSPGLRVIAPGPASAPGYSPLDEAIALQPSSSEDRQRDRDKQRERSEEHARAHVQRTTAMHQPRTINPELGLRPVVEWGNRSGSEDEEEGDSSSSPVRAGLSQGGLHKQEMTDCTPPQNGESITTSPDATQPGKDPRREPDKVSDAMQIEPIVNGISNRHIANDSITSPIPYNDVDLNLDADADAEAEVDEDEDAEGEEEDEEEEERETDLGSRDHPSRSRTPPPPDPPAPGPDNGSSQADDDPDADADAEGEMEFDESEEPPPPPSASSAPQQGARRTFSTNLSSCRSFGQGTKRRKDREDVVDPTFPALAQPLWISGAIVLIEEFKEPDAMDQRTPDVNVRTDSDSGAKTSTVRRQRGQESQVSSRTAWPRNCHVKWSMFERGLSIETIMSITTPELQGLSRAHIAT
ncbi:hypothetical protein B0H34DRAFT_256268 [Crassisporium funariophilum]|nr:hypothetical protein B0H34DRAFT_256268 [Crassisporium funariophilum]